MDKPLDPYKVMCVVTHEGREVGRIAASAPNAPAYLDELARFYGTLSVEYVEDPTAAMISRIFNTKTTGT
jgi:hypothetical protein